MYFFSIGHNSQNFIFLSKLKQFNFVLDKHKDAVTQISISPDYQYLGKCIILSNNFMYNMNP